MPEWTAVRTSTPAENVPGVPDNSIVYGAWCEVGTDRGVTVYKIENRYTTVTHSGVETTVEVGPTTNKERALARAEDLVGGRRILA